MANRRLLERGPPKMPPEMWLETWQYYNAADRWSARQACRLFNAIDRREKRVGLFLFLAWEQAAYNGSRFCSKLWFAEVQTTGTGR